MSDQGAPLVLLMQLPVPNNTATNVPLAAGYLKAFAQAQGLLARVQVEILPRALADAAGDALLVDAIVARRPAMLGISLYTWNSERSLAVALRVRERLPGLVVVVGGPEVQRDTTWVLEHPAVDVAVIGEGEQTFAALLGLLADDGAWPDRERLAAIPGVVFRSEGDLLFAPEREALADLAPLPSPYLLGYLEVNPGDMLMVEVSRWCPYGCSFCLYGRNMGPRLGSRYFPLERLLAEIRWGYERGLRRIHFVEANLNLVPVFWPLMRALEDLNAAGELALYAELRGEHIGDAVADALLAAGLRVAEVGLQTANPSALRAARRRTDLQAWAAGTRRLLARGVEVFLDVIVGLPADDASGVAETLNFIRRENLGGYDAFTLQVLPGTAVRSEAADWGLVFQQRPPYYVLATNRLPYTELRRLRRELKLGVGLDPDEVEGCPPPRLHALVQPALAASDPIRWVDASNPPDPRRLAAHVDIVGRWDASGAWFRWLAQAIADNPATLFDLYLLCDEPPPPAALRAWRDELPYTPGYLDRVAAYTHHEPEVGHQRVSPRLWLVLPWVAQAEPADYAGVAELIWAYDLAPGEEPPLRAWAAAGGAGVWARGVAASVAARWAEQGELQVWGSEIKG